MFFEDWFNEYPASEPCTDEPTDSEHESDSDSEQTDGECRPASSKQKRRRTRKNVIVSRIDFNLVSIP